VPYEIPEWRSGKQTRKGKPSPTEPFPVTVIHRHEAREFFNCADDTELRRHLRGLRDLGVLVCKPGRLTQKVRVGPREHVIAYVCKGQASDLPRRKQRRRARVFTA
jgi:hypothetical protein